MLVHPSAQASTDLVLQVIRDLAPHLVATDFHCLGPPVRMYTDFVFHPSMCDAIASLSEAISQWSRRHYLSLAQKRNQHHVISPDNAIKPIQCFHCDIWPDT